MTLRWTFYQYNMFYCDEFLTFLFSNIITGDNNITRIKVLV